MPVHILDSPILQDLFGTPQMRGVFDNQSTVQKWLDFEVALARAEAEIGVIPQSAAVEITRVSQAERIDMARLKQGIDFTMHPIVPLLRLVGELCQGGAGEWVHYGATTQDAIDTGLVLQIKDAIGIFSQRLGEMDTMLTDLARRYRDTLMPGRTHGQHALPITFGFKVAVWLDEFRRHAARLDACKGRVLTGQFGGAVGTLAGVAEHGIDIRRRMMALLGLGVPTITWHVAHDDFAEFANVVSLIAGSCGKIAHEIILLQKSEVMEVEEPWAEGKVGSSTMPHKRNPMMCEAIVALARLCFNQARAALDGMIVEHERDWTFNHMEWAYLPELCVMADGALAQTLRVLHGMRIYPDRMRQNIDALGGLMLSENVMFALGERIGKQTAHHVVQDCAMRSVNEHISFADALAADPTVSSHLTQDDIARLLDPTHYTGLAGAMVDAVLAARKTDHAAQP